MDIILLYILLFFTLFASFIFLIVPDKIYQTSPALLMTDTIKRKVSNHYQTKEVLSKIQLMEKETKTLFTTGIIIGVSTALLMGIVAFVIFPALIPIGIILGLAVGILLVNIAIENEHQKYQREMAIGALPLVRFMPSFLEVDGIIPREALTNTLPFVPDPLQKELKIAISRIVRTGRVHESLNELTSKTSDPIVHAIVFRLSSAWDARVTADLFDDLEDQMQNKEREAITHATTIKTGLLPLVVVLGLIGAIFAFGYPAIQFLANQFAFFQ